MTTRILLADAQLMVREGLKRILEHDGNFTIVSEESDGLLAVDRIISTRPDVAILEFTLPRLSGVEVIRRVAGRVPTRSLILSHGHSRSQVQEALRCGAAGYLLKTAPPSQLLDAVDVVRQGKFYFSPDVARHVVDAAASRQGFERHDLANLTGREHEVLQLVASGMSSKEIAESLGISSRTAESHRARIMSKLDIHNVSGLVRLAIREGLLEA